MDLCLKQGTCIPKGFVGFEPTKSNYFGGNYKKPLSPIDR